MNEQARLLQDHPLFARLSGRALRHLTEHARVVRLARGRAVYSAGEPGDSLYVMLSGRCQSELKLPSGETKVLGTYGAGDTFGERALLSGDRHWSTIRVITDAALLRLDAADVYRVIDRDARFARQFAQQIRHDLASRAHTGAHPERAMPGRVVVIASATRDDIGPVVGENISSAVREISGRDVLFARVRAGGDHPALADYHHAGSRLKSVFSLLDRVTPGEGGVHELTMYARGDAREPENVAACVGQMARHYPHTVVQLDANVPMPTLIAFLRQTDSQYLLLRQQSDDLYRANLLARELRERDPDGQISLMPIVCLDERESADPYETLSGQIGLRVHNILHGTPGAGGEPREHYIRNPGDRFSAHIRQLAREICRCRLGLALSSGGAKGLAHIGVIQVLEENNIEVDAIAGASMGALIGAMWACGLSGRQIEEIALRLERPFTLLNLIDFSFPPRRGFMKGGKLERFVREAIGDRHFSQAHRQFRVVATDLETLERCVFDSGEIAPAVVASMAMPGVVVPARVDGRVLTDGGVGDPLPVDVLIELGVDRIIGVNTIPNPEELKSCLLVSREQHPTRKSWFHLPRVLDRHLNYFSPGNILDILVRSMHGAETRVAEMACRRADVVLRAVSCDGKWHDFRNPRKYIDIGRQVAEERLDELKALAHT